MAASVNNIKATAFIAVAQAFMTACEDNGIDDFALALERVAGVCGVNLFKPTSSQVKPEGSGIQQSVIRRNLTPDESKQAKAVARERKAQKLKVSVAEINLTPQEAEQARKEFRDLIARGEPLPTVSSIRQKSTGKTSAVPEARTSPKGQGKAEKPLKDISASEQSEVGSADTSWTRVSTARRNCKREFPLEVSKPCGLHLVAYTNEFHRLRYQWATYKAAYPEDAKTKSDVFRGLVDPEGDKTPTTRSYLTDLVGSLKEHVNQPFVTWILQDEDGRSFFEKGRPSEVCPKKLAESIPKKVLKELSDARFDLSSDEE